MFGDGDDAGQCSNGLSPGTYRAASAEDRATYRRWVRGLVVFYVTLLLVSGAVALVHYRDAGPTMLTTLDQPATTGALKPRGSN
jgi:hypothetical protein